MLELYRAALRLRASLLCYDKEECDSEEEHSRSETDLTTDRKLSWLLGEWFIYIILLDS